MQTCRPVIAGPIERQWINALNMKDGLYKCNNVFVQMRLWSLIFAIFLEYSMVCRKTILATCSLSVVAFLSACGSAPVGNAPASAAPVASEVKPAAPKAAASTSLASPVAAVVVKPAYLDAANPLSHQRSVFFGYDNFSVTGEYQPLIEMHGRFLASNPKVSIRVEGNADERGSAEYNLALGQKRAESVARALKVYGVKDEQMEAISWGEEKPMESARSDAAFAKNRRVDLVYPSK